MRRVQHAQGVFRHKRPFLDARPHRLLEAGRGCCPAADFDAVARALAQIERLVTDPPEIRELHINPLLAHAGGVIALDARIAVDPVPPGRVTAA